MKYNIKCNTKNIITCLEMKNTGLLNEDEIKFIEKNRSVLGNIGTTEYYLSITGKEKNDPLRRQFVPDPRELNILEYEKKDPLCEKKYSPGWRIVHRYRNRVLFLASGRCALYCRHCFRKYLGDGFMPDALPEDADLLASYLYRNNYVNEVLISGGDPLMLDNSMLDYLCRKIRDVNKKIIIRIGTRIPVVYPSRIDNDLAAVFEKYRPLYIFTQFNHEREITEKSAGAVEMFLKKGIPVLNQTVLLKGINDSEAQLEKLFTMLTEISVKPYYLFQGDLASGTSHFRTPLPDGINLMEKLRSRLSALSLPLLAVDLPDGGGKVLLDRNSLSRREGRFFYLKNSEGNGYYPYPDES